jgi:hypothetical protein
MSEQKQAPQATAAGVEAARPAGSPAWERWLRSAQQLFAVVAALPVALFLRAAIGRLHYPFPLEELEGPMLLAAERIAHGLPLYVAPNIHFIPYMYAPGYSYVAGWLVRWMGGPGFLPLRLLSLLATCVSFALLYGMVLLEAPKAESRRPVLRHAAALAAAGAYATAYPWTRWWFDLGRVDSFYVCLFLLAVFVTRLTMDRLPVVAAVAWLLAFLAKQTILPVGVVALCYDWRQPRRMLAGAGSLLVLAGISFLWLNHGTDGWFHFYAFSVPRANADLVLRPAVFYWPSVILAPYGVALALVLLAVLLTRPRWQDARTRFYAMTTGTVLALCWFLQAHSGATANTAMPAYAMLSLLFGISLVRLDAYFAARGLEAARVAMLAAAVLPLVSWAYQPHDIIPPRGLVDAHLRRVAWIRSFAGDIYEPEHPSEAIVAGKPWRPDAAALHDALAALPVEDRQALIARIRQTVDDPQHMDAILLERLPAEELKRYKWLPPDLQQRYPVLGLTPDADMGDPYSPHAVYFLLPCRELALARQRGWILLQNGCAAGLSPENH